MGRIALEEIWRAHHQAPGGYQIIEAACGVRILMVAAKTRQKGRNSC